MTDRDELVRDYMKPLRDWQEQLRYDGPFQVPAYEDFAPMVRAMERMAARIEADGKLFAEMREALLVARRTILEGGGGGVDCVVWVPEDVSPSETLVDYIDAVLARLDAGSQR